jgi:taurine dioxygenase
VPETLNFREAASVCEAVAISGAPFGLEVKADLSRELTETEKTALRQLYLRDGLLLMRGQNLSQDQQDDACSIFGPVLREEHAMISNIEEDGILGSLELLFHNDLPYLPAPFLGASLFALRVSEPAVPTRFASGMTAYERLPADLRLRIDHRNALHVRARASMRRTRLTDSQPADNCAVHALVGHQQTTERPYIFANLDMTALVIGLSEAESDDLLEELFSYLYDDKHVYDHPWRQGDIVIWDNLALQHARSAIKGGTRTLQRSTIARFGAMAQNPVDLVPDIQNNLILHDG